MVSTLGNYTAANWAVLKLMRFVLVRTLFVSNSNQTNLREKRVGSDHLLDGYKRCLRQHRAGL